MLGNNILAIYKPVGPTSHDVVNQVRKITGIKKVGHAGTLDPLASGVLVIGVGREATRELGKHERTEKEYLAAIKLSENSTTDDAEGEKEAVAVKTVPTLEMITGAVKAFIGKIQQTPPAYSAINIKGQRAYDLARRGKEVKLQPRTVEIKAITIISYLWPELKLRVTTGPGVYIRSLARDLGERLGTGGYLAGLERTRVGRYGKDQALSLNQLPAWWLKAQEVENN